MTMLAAVRSADLVARIGHDEFGVILNMASRRSIVTSQLHRISLSVTGEGLPGISDAALRAAYARILVDNKQFDEARKQFQTLLKDQPDNIATLYALGVMGMNLPERFGGPGVTPTAMLMSLVAISRACAAVRANGFSQRTCLPARNAAMARSWCASVGAQMSTAWMSGSASMAA